MIRRGKIEGTRDFLYMAIAVLVLGIWAVKDGWFPSQAVLRKHPQPTELSSPAGAVVSELHTAAGALVNPDQKVITLRLDHDGSEQSLKAPFEGVVKLLPVRKGDGVKEGQVLIHIGTDEGFYLFNKSLAFVCGVGAIALFIVHLRVK